MKCTVEREFNFITGDKIVGNIKSTEGEALFGVEWINAFDQARGIVNALAVSISEEKGGQATGVTHAYLERVVGRLGDRSHEWIIVESLDAILWAQNRVCSVDHALSRPMRSTGGLRDKLHGGRCRSGIVHARRQRV